MVSFLLIGSGGNDPNQVNPNQITGVIDEDNYDFIDEDVFPDSDDTDDTEGTDSEGNDE